MQPTSIKIIKKLKSKGYKAYWAGGCVRDILLNKKPQDYDIVTNATPDEIEKILKHTIPVGKKFGVILAIENKHHFEIATFRKEENYKDGRRPETVNFTDEKEDALRRDFTINGMFYDPIEDKIIDYVNGLQDLEARIIKFIGNPEERIKEDHLRILRAVRFKNQLNFQYDPETYKALLKNAHLVKKISRERIQQELNKMILTTPPSMPFRDMEDLGILKEILPELQNLKGVAQPYNYHQEGDVWTHTMKAIDSLSKTSSLEVRLAVLFHDIGKPETYKLKERIRFDHHAGISKDIAIKIMKRLAYPLKTIKEVAWLIEHHMIMQQLLEMPQGRKMHWFLHPYFLNLMQVFKADIAGTIPEDYSLYEKILKSYRTSIKKIPKMPKPLLNGKEIMKITGLKAGKKVGELIKKLLHQQLEHRIKNKDEAIQYIKKQV